MSKKPRAARRAEARAAAKAGPPGPMTSTLVNEGDGLLTLKVNLQGAPPPDHVTFANTAVAAPRGNVLAFGFGQVAPGVRGVKAIVGVELSRMSVRRFVENIDPVRAVLRSSDDSFIPFPQDATPDATITYPAHIVKVVTNEFLSVLDFHIVVPRDGFEVEILPAVRILANQSLLAWFIRECEAFASVESASAEERR